MKSNSVFQTHSWKGFLVVVVVIQTVKKHQKEEALLKGNCKRTANHV